MSPGLWIDEFSIEDEVERGIICDNGAQAIMLGMVGIAIEEGKEYEFFVWRVCTYINK
jgi:hypothetical protein